MSKHPGAKHPKKKSHPKKIEIPVQALKDSIPSFSLFWLTVFGLFFVVLPGLFAGMWALGAFEMKYNDRFLPNIFVGGEPVGGQTYAEALNHYTEKALALKKDGLLADFETSKGVRKINIPISESGLTPDNSIEYFTLGNWENDLAKAYEWGHGKNPFTGLARQLTLVFFKKNFVFSAAMQKEAVNSLLEGELYALFEKSVPAGFVSTKGKVSISKEESGESLNKEEVVDVLEQKLIVFDTTPATFKMHTDVPTVTEADLEPFLNFAENFAKETNLVLGFQGRQWQIKGPKLVTFLTVKKDGNKEGTLTVDRVKLQDYLTTTVAKYIDNPPQNSRFEIQNGKLVEIVRGKAGNVVDIDKAVQKIEKIIPEVEKSFAATGGYVLSAAALHAIGSEVDFDPDNGTIYLPIETMQVEPKVTSETVEKYHIKDLVGEIRTNFTGSTADREHNIKVGIAAIAGILIAPGAEFSTVASIGPVTGKEGYVKELVIKEDRTTKEYGGGLCQVATTLFRLALNSGLPITERINHRFVVHYYDPPGLDATIYGPHPDLRFVNDTGNYLLLQARVENKQVIMELYGQKDGRSAEVSQPVMYDRIPAPETRYVPTPDLAVGETKCSETPHDGLTTNVLYTVKYPDGSIKEKNFQSVYKPWQKVCLVGTALPNPI